MTQISSQEEHSKQILEINPDWDVQWSCRTGRKQGQVGMVLQASGKCPGYEWTIMPWCLRKETARVEDEDIEILAEKAFSELNRVLERDIFEKDTQKQDSSFEKIRTSRRGLPLCVAAEANKQMDPHVGEMLIKMLRSLFAPAVAPLAVPLLTLIGRDRVLYRIERKSWPFSGPPTCLEHLAEGGFAGCLPWGILAYPAPGETPWIVKDYCETNVKGGKGAACSGAVGLTAFEREKLALLPDIKNMLLAFSPHIFGIPKLKADCREAEIDPSEAAQDINNRFHMALGPELFPIYLVLRAVGWVRKYALPLLKDHRIYSLPTLSRHIKKINKQLEKFDLGKIPLSKKEPPQRYQNAYGEKPAGRFDPMNHQLNELTVGIQDWAKDKNERDSTIKQFLKTPEDDKKWFRKEYQDIDAEAKKYMKRQVHGKGMENADVPVDLVEE